MKNKNVSIGLSFGAIIGLVYVVLLLWRWKSAENIIMFAATAIIGFLVILGLMFYEAHYRRKENGGEISLKDLFQTLFLSVLVFELLYLLFNFVYLKFIDPDVVDRMKAAMQVMLDKAGDQMTEADKAKQLASLDKINDSTQPLGMLKNYCIGVAISGVFALIVAAIMKRNKKVVFEN